MTKLQCACRLFVSVAVLGNREATDENISDAAKPIVASMPFRFRVTCGQFRKICIQIADTDLVTIPSMGCLMTVVDFQAFRSDHQLRSAICLQWGAGIF